MSSNELENVTQYAAFEASARRVAELGRSGTIDTFTIAQSVSFIIHTQVGGDPDRYLNASTGDLIDLGGGSWIFAGTATGRKGQRPIVTPWNFEYNAAVDSMTIQVFGRSNTFGGVSDISSALQFRKGINGFPTLILVRKSILIDNHDDIYAYRAAPGSYIQFG